MLQNAILKTNIIDLTKFPAISRPDVTKYIYAPVYNFNAITPENYYDLQTV